MPCVLLVEDWDDDRCMYSDYLRALGFAVVESDNLATAMALADRADIVVTDLGLARDRLAGLALIEHLRRERSRQVPVIVVTANGTSDDRQRVIEAGCDSYLLKPCLPDVLAAEIERLLDSRAINPR